MASFPLSDILGKLKDGATRALRITGETKITNDASSPVAMSLTGSNAKDSETLNIDQTAKGFAKTVAGASKAVVTTETSDIRYWVSGSVPTATNGHLIKAGGSFELDSAEQITKFKAIAVSGTAVLQISYF